MKRTKEWWAALAPDERSHLVYIERGNLGGRSPYLPDDCSECNACGSPMFGSGLCPSCYEAWKSYVDKADQAIKVLESEE